MKGVFISIEGMDGSGKSTAIAHIKASFEALGRTVVLGREPGGSSVGELIRHTILENKMCAKTELLLFMAARAQNVDEIIKPGIARGDVVIFDRFADSSYAYQGYARGLLDFLVQHEDLTTGGIEPDYTLYLRLSLETSVKRMTGRDIPLDRLDKEDISFKQRAFEGYEARMRENPHRFVVIDAEGDMQSVRDQLTSWINKTFTKE